MGISLGAGPSRVAHRVFRHGERYYWRKHRHSRGRGRPHVPAPRQRNGSSGSVPQVLPVGQLLHARRSPAHQGSQDVQVVEEFYHHPSSAGRTHAETTAIDVLDATLGQAHELQRPNGGRRQSEREVLQELFRCREVRSTERFRRRTAGMEPTRPRDLGYPQRNAKEGPLVSLGQHENLRGHPTPGRSRDGVQQVHDRGRKAQEPRRQEGGSVRHEDSSSFRRRERKRHDRVRRQRRRRRRQRLRVEGGRGGTVRRRLGGISRKNPRVGQGQERTGRIPQAVRRIPRRNAGEPRNSHRRFERDLDLEDGRPGGDPEGSGRKEEEGRGSRREETAGEDRQARRGHRQGKTGERTALGALQEPKGQRVEQLRRNGETLDREERGTHFEIAEQGHSEGTEKPPEGVRQTGEDRRGERSGARKRVHRLVGKTAGRIKARASEIRKKTKTKTKTKTKKEESEKKKKTNQKKRKNVFFFNIRNRVILIFYFNFFFCAALFLLFV